MPKLVNFKLLQTLSYTLKPINSICILFPELDLKKTIKSLKGYVTFSIIIFNVCWIGKCPPLSRFYKLPAGETPSFKPPPEAIKNIYKKITPRGSKLNRLPLVQNSYHRCAWYGRGQEKCRICSDRIFEEMSALKFTKISRPK